MYYTCKYNNECEAQQHKGVVRCSVIHGILFCCCPDGGFVGMISLLSHHWYHFAFSLLALLLRIIYCSAVPGTIIIQDDTKGQTEKKGLLPLFCA